MISAYYVALERTMFMGEVDPASLKIWEANVAAHEFGMSLLKPGVGCAEITRQINDLSAIPHLWLWPFIWRAEPLLWPRRQA